MVKAQTTNKARIARKFDISKISVVKRNAGITTKKLIRSPNRAVPLNPKLLWIIHDLETLQQKGESLELVSINLIIALIGITGFFLLGGARFSADLIQTARADLSVFKASLKSDNVMDINSKTEAGKLGQEG